MGLVIKRAEREDAPAILDLIIALATFEKLTPPDEEAKARFLADGWCERPRFEAWIARVDGEPAGYAITFETYSSFLCRPTLYLEDLFVLPEWRKQGIGDAMFRHLVREAHTRGCGRMEWTCLDWNVNAQRFYEKIGARHLTEWYTYRLGMEEIERLSLESRV